MLHKTRGIVLHTTDYSETSIVAKVYTEAFGMQSYLVNSVRSRKARFRPSLFQPLSLLEMVVYHKERGGLQRISEIRNVPQYREIPFDPVKSSMLLFLNEMLYKCVREEEPNSALFEYLFNSLQVLDLQSPASRDFHLLFLIRLARYLGFYPSGAYSEETPVFNLQEGDYQSGIPAHPFYLRGPESAYFSKLIESSSDLSSEIEMPLEVKRELIDRTIEYYRLHIEGFGELKSHKVLESVWS